MQHKMPSYATLGTVCQARLVEHSRQQHCVPSTDKVTELSSTVHPEVTPLCVEGCTVSAFVQLPHLPGPMALTRMLCGARDRAMQRVRLSMPPFDAL
jgi:hypothetical protein